MSETLNLGNGNWATKEDSLLAYNSENGNFKPLPFDFTRASSATVVNKDGLIETVGSGEPRIDFKDDAKGALLLEPTRSNLITYSEDFSSFTQNGCSVISDDISFTLGGLADKIQEDSSNSNKHVRPSNCSILSGQSYIMSAWFKSDNCDVIALREGSSSGDSITYKFSTGTTSTTGTRWTSLNVVNFSNGWRRIDAKYTSTSTASMNFRVHLLGNNYSQVTNLNPSTYTYQGNGTSGIYMWGLTVEQGSYATSYIPTSGSAVTRVAESCNNGGNEQVINSTEGVFYLEISSLANDSSERYLSISDGTTANRISLWYYGATNGLAVAIYSSSATQFFTTTVLTNDTDLNKIAIKYKVNNFALWINGIEISTDIIGIAPIGLSELSFNRGNNTVPFYGKTKDVRVYNTALTDAELQALTTI